MTGKCRLFVRYFKELGFPDGNYLGNLAGRLIVHPGDVPLSWRAVPASFHEQRVSFGTQRENGGTGNLLRI